MSVAEEQKVNIRFEPVGDSFILVPDEAKEMSPGGVIHIPEGSQEKPKTGTVIAVGEGRYNSLLGQYIGMPVKANDRILYKPFAGLEIELGGEIALVLKSEDIMAKIIVEPHEDEDED